MGKSTSTSRNYKHLSIEEREELSNGLAAQRSLTDIGKSLGRSPSTLSRELSRNGTPIRNCRYRCLRAQIKADARSSAAHQRERLADPRVRKYVEANLRIGVTPALIAGRIRIDHPELSTNYESIYQWIFIDRNELIRFLPRKRRKRHKRRCLRVNRVGKIPNRIPITERPTEVESRIVPGHWEGDTAVSRQSKPVMVMLRERTSRKIVLCRVPSKSAHDTSSAIIRRLSKFPRELLKTITYDNGTENAEHVRVNILLGTSSYFCAPYHSWEKGSVENAIGLMRRYLPKKTDFAKVLLSTIKMIEDRINNRPMKCLGFRTPNEVYATFALAG